MLVVTSKPQREESLMGYLLHLTETNGYPSTSYIVSMLNGRWYSTTIGRLDAARLADVAGLGPDEIARLTMLPQDMPRAFVRVYGNDLPSYEVGAREPKVCPLCLQEGQRCEAFWDLTQAAACPRHGVRLLSNCPGCVKPLRWSRKQVRVCNCGSDLAQWPAEPVPAPLRDLMALMRHLTYRGEVATDVPETLRHLEHLTLRQLCKMLWVMTYLMRELVPDRARSKARKNYRRELEQVAEILCEWPLNFRVFLEARYGSRLSEEEPLPPFYTLFSWLIGRLMKNVEGGADAYRFLAQEVVVFGARHWTQSALSSLASAAPPDTHYRWGTRGEACQALGLHPLTLMKRLQAGEIPTRTLSGASNRAVMVDLDWVRSQRQSRFPAISMRDAAKQAGVSIETLREMCASGLYERTYRPSYPGALTVEDIDHLANRLGALLAGKQQLRGSEVITLDRAFQVFGATPAEKAAVYQWLLTNPGNVLGRATKGAGLGRIQLRQETMESWLAKNRDEDPCVTVRFAGRRLGCSDAIVTALKRAGHLECKKVRGRLYPRKASLARFAEDYESMIRVARRIDVAIKRVYARVDLAKIRHIKVKSVQYSTVFVHRADKRKTESLLRDIKPQ